MNNTAVAIEQIIQGNRCQTMSQIEVVRKILLVDDDEAIRGMLRSMFELEGYQVFEALDGREGIEKASFLEPHLIILDIMMPNLDGFEVCERLRRNHKTRETPVIVMSVRGEVEDKIRMLTSGADDYILKPFDPGELIARVGAQLRKIELLSEKNVMLEKLAGKLAAMNLDLREQAVTDGLTKLYNHRHFIQRLNEEASRVKRYGGKFSLVFYDIDHFKQVNDNWGHHIGDNVLVDIAHILQEGVRGVDLVSRYGGEEFAMLLPETPSDGAQVMADRIRIKVAAYDFPCGPLSISGGIATFPLHADDANSLLKKADAALYRAKRTGRNRIAIWNEF